MLWIILICLAVIVIFISWWLQIDNSSVLNSDNSSEDFQPTMHARCREDVPCGGDLICDIKCKRCKQKINGDCAEDVDCETGLRCYHWKCVPADKNIINDNNDEDYHIELSKDLTHKVSWKPTNDIFYI
jgi:hypothetical protein